MKITRNTMRADGQTVGEAMDADAAFLRSIGLPAKDGQPTFDEKQDAIQKELEAYTDSFRQKVLDAIDEAAGGEGWKDSDLKELFKPVDKLAKRSFLKVRELEELENGTIFPKGYWD